jgi:hypothetical protein
MKAARPMKERRSERRVRYEMINCGEQTEKEQVELRLGEDGHDDEQEKEGCNRA